MAAWQHGSMAAWQHGSMAGLQADALTPISEAPHPSSMGCLSRQPMRFRKEP
jgi:hypothetical protein